MRPDVRELLCAYSMVRRRPGVGLLAEVDDEFFEGDVFGRFEGALDLVHGVDAARLFRMRSR